MSIVWLALAFVVTALLYSSVGFGGGSTYTALLVLSGLSIPLVPLISLVCNLTVTSIGTVRASMAGLYAHTRIREILICSVPAAFLGGLMPIKDKTLLLLLGVMLLLSGAQLAWSVLRNREAQTVKTAQGRGQLILAMSVGLGVGYASGLVGIGGGIFLAPVLHFIGWATPKRIAAISSAYIAANSLAGLAGKLLQFQASGLGWESLLAYWPLIPSVLIGSFIGHRLLFGVFPQRIVKAATAFLILFVGVRILLTTI